MRQQSSITTLYFGRGQSVIVDCSLNPDGFYKPLHGLRGTVETESTHRPGYYFVRMQDEIDGMGPKPLMLIPWHTLKLAEENNVPG